MRKNWDERLVELWHKESRPFFRASMSLQRVEQILRFMRFDNHRTRTERLQIDKLAAFRDVWLLFQENLKLAYRPGNLTVDEQLVATRGRCNFRQYIPSKPGKYGIKIFWVVDAKNSYPLNGEIYIGCQPGEKSAKDYAFNLVNRLARPYVKKGRTITMDNFFTSCALAEDMIRQKTTIIGTIRSNKPDLPVELAAHKAQDKKMYIKNREVGSSRFCFDGYLTLVSYIPKPNKNVLLLSTLHNNDDIDETSGKPNIILDYNSSKGGVDTMDKLAKTYTCKRITRRWPMVLFFNMIDVAAIAAFNIHKLARPDAYVQKKSNTRKLFLEILAKQLVDQHIRKRLSNPNALKKKRKNCDAVDGL